MKRLFKIVNFQIFFLNQKMDKNYDQ
jgi:hypothetical protein